MPSASLHLTHVELLAEASQLNGIFQEALRQELTYARLGAVFHDLPFYTNIVTMTLGYWLEMPAEYCPFAQKMHRYHPDQFAWHFLKAAALREGGLSRNQRLALLGGFLAHIALDLELHPLVNWCARRDSMLQGGHESHHHRLTEKYHSLFFHRELSGHDIIGTPSFFTQKTKIFDRPPFFRLNLAVPAVQWSAETLSGFYQEAAPSMRQFASWVRSFRHFALLVSSPMAKRNSGRLGNDENRRWYYEDDEFSFRKFWERGFQRSIELLNLAGSVIEQASWSDEACAAFLSGANISDLSYPPEHHLPPLPQADPELVGYQLTA
jgi:hypothetical protein